MGLITNINGLTGHADDGCFCGNGVTTPYDTKSVKSIYNDGQALTSVYGGHYIPRDAMKSMNGIDELILPPEPFGGGCTWHPVRYTGPFESCVGSILSYVGVAGSVEIRGTAPQWLLVAGAKAILPMVPTEPMSFSTGQNFVKYEVNPAIPELGAIPDEGYYILWGRYGVDTAGVKFQFAQFDGISLTPMGVGAEGNPVCGW